MRICDDPRDDHLHHEVTVVVWDTDLHDWVPTVCGLKVRRGSTYLSDDQTANCVWCIAREPHP